MESELPDTSINSEAQSKSFYFLHKLKNGSFVSHSLVANLRSPQQQDLLFVKVYFISFNAILICFENKREICWKSYL